MKLKKSLAKVLVDAEIDLSGEDRIKEAAKVLVEGGYVKHDRGLWADISAQLIEPARERKHAQEKRNQQKRERGRNSLLKTLNVKTWNQATKLGDQQLEIDPRSDIQKQALAELRSQVEAARAETDAAERRTADIEAGNVRKIYSGRDGTAVRLLYKELRRRGEDGELAVLLLTAQNASGRAKHSNRRAKQGRYEIKEKALKKLVEHLQKRSYKWGWGKDENCHYDNVLYLELPTGQVSWHSALRGEGDDYSGEWDGVPEASTLRIIAFAESPFGASRLVRIVAD